MFMFKTCRDVNWHLDLFWNSKTPELTNCLHYYGFNILPIIIFFSIFLIDLLINRQLSQKNKLTDYLKTYYIRSFIYIILIGCCFFKLVQLFVFFYLPIINDAQLFQLVLLASILKLCVYILLFLFDVKHFLKNIGISSLSSLIVLIDWISKVYLLLEISYLHPNSYTNYEYVESIIQSICMTILLISYVFLPNPIINKYAESDPLIDPQVKLKSKCEKSTTQTSNKFSVDNKSLISQIMFFYFDKYILFGYRKKFNIENIIPIKEELMVNNVLNNYKVNYKDKYMKDSKMDNYNILHLIYNLYKFFFLFNLFIFIIQILLAQFEPQIIKWIITFVQLKQDIKWHGYLFTFALLFSTLTRVTILGIFNRNINYLQTKIQIILVNHIYKKVLKRSSLKVDQNFDTYNLMTVDVDIVLDVMYFCFDFLQITLNAVLSIYFIYKEIDVSIFYALSVFLIIVPFSYLVGKKTKSVQKRTMKAKDSRLKLLSELINGIKTVKLNYFDEVLKRKITDVRRDEVKNFKRYQIFYGTLSVSFYLLPNFLFILSVFIYLSIDEQNELTLERAFTTLNYFNLLKSSIIVMPRLLHLIVTSVVAVKRIQSFLRSEEKDNYVMRKFDEDYAIEIGKDVNFSWESNTKLTSECILKNLNLKIKKNSLVALLSKTVASGRSSFLACLLGEIRLVSNDKYQNDEQKLNISKELKIAFVSSKPWIESKTIKENILFGLPFSQNKYNHALDYCLIRNELINYPNGDNQIMNQNFDLEFKQKVCLARAYYSEANLVLLDDFLSIFNDYSAEILFDNLINPNKNSLFKNKTCIMVLNNSKYIKYFNQLLYFNNGEITSVINFNKNLENNNEFENQSVDLLRKRCVNSKILKYDDLDTLFEEKDKHDEKNCKICTKKLIADDDAEFSYPSWPIYKLYLKTWTWKLILCIVSYFLTIVFEIVLNNWLSYWSSNSKNVKKDELKDYNRKGLSHYMIISLFFCFFFALANFSAIYGEVSSAIKFHKILLCKILKLPLFFFDKTLTGSIMNRFSRDIETVDHVISYLLKITIYFFLQILAVFWVIIFNFSEILILILIMVTIYYCLFKLFIKTVIPARRLELQTRNVLYNSLEELSNGSQTIVAYDRSELFIKTLNSNLEQNVRCSYMIYIAFKWFDLRNQMIALIILIATSLFSIYNSDTIDGNEAAIVFNYSLQLLGLLAAFMGLASDFLINFVSIERIYQYLELDEQLPHNDNSFTLENLEKIDGRIKFVNYSSAYTECRKATLSNLNFEIDKNSLIAIVGKSDSGKSTLLLSIFNEVKTLKGKILIDDFNITKICSELLKKNIAVFPKDASLFTGTIRFNLDPEDRYNDIELWTVLDYVGIKDQILSLKGNLYHHIDGQKSALSVGQQQLLCLARTFLKQSKVMIIDETNCQFDLQTEMRLGQLFKTVFKERTILLITKSIKHIQLADKILFLHNGQIKDFRTPKEIFDDANENNSEISNVMQNNNSEILDLLNNNN